MRRAGMNVPKLFCIPAAYFDENEVPSAGRLAALVAGGIEDCCMTAELFSVRSSALCEDGAAFSFAGQFDTFLNVPRSELADRVTDCVRSLTSENVLEYCKLNGIPHSVLRMSVIIQEMAAAELSGVIFSANPIGILNETVIVAGFGCGEGVVGGSVPVTTCCFNRTDRTHYLESEEGAPLLPEELILRLIEICERTEELFGGINDIEFSVSGGEIFILQSRPITTLDDSSPTILDNSNIVESYPGITLPLTASFVDEAYYGVFRGLAKRCLKSERLVSRYDGVLRSMTGSANGRIYYKISNWYTLIRFLPMSGKIIPVWQDMMGVSVKEQSGSGSGLSPLRRLLTYISAVYEAFSVPRNMKRLQKKFSAVSMLYGSSMHEGMTPEELKALYDKISASVLSCWDITLLNDMYAFVFTGLLKSRFRRLSPDTFEGDTAAYISGITNIESMKPLRALIRLAVCAAEGGLVPRLAELTSDKDVSELLSSAPEEFADAFRSYIDLYGDRAPEELKLETVTFRVSPLLLVKKLLEYASDERRLYELAEELNASEPQLPSSVLAKCGAAERRLIRFLSKKAALGIGNREASRLNRTRIYGMVRSIMLELGERLCERKIIDSPRDIFMLTLEEVFGAADGGEGLNSIVSQRRGEYRVYEQLPACSRLVFSGEVVNKRHKNVNSVTLTEDTDENLLIGTPCSNGKATAEAVVITDISDIPEIKGRIIVARMTDPGWVFMLTVAAGIISEKGSLLSHTAIISRELKIPAAVGVKNACSVIKSGDLITLDGSTGRVEIVKRSGGNV